MPSGVEVAQAYITIIPSMKGIQGDIAKQLGAEKVGNDAGKKLGKGISDGAKRSGDDLMKSFGSTGDRIAFKTRTGLETAFGNAAKTAQTKMSGAATAITDKFKAMGSRIAGTALGTTLGNVFGKFGETARGVFDRVSGFAKTSFSKVSGVVRGAAQFAGDAFRTVASTIGERLQPVMDVAKTVFGKVGEFASAGFDVVVKAAAIGGGAAAAAIGAITKSSFDAYADYEQLAGGVEKLYGKSADTLMKYAQDAYKTSGMSANDYMETATSFSAALIKSVGGDTEEAARLTDVAMRAMSDNVNTFGTNAGDVQNAIMGLSRENYSMLDNLKLGYAGTQQGMMDLINDSGVLGEKLTDTSQLGEVGFGKMIEAIQKVQEQQNIAGTTAKEAASTISGSIGMTQAAWSNLVTEMGKDDGDVPARVGELVDSALLVLQNAVPRVATIVGAIINQVPPAIAANAPKILAALTSALDGVTNGAFSKAVNAVRPYAERIGTAASDLWNRLKPLSPIVQEIGGKLGGILKTAIAAATSAFEKVAPIIATIAEHALPILSSAVSVVSDAFDAALAILEPVASFLTDTLGAAVDWIGERLEELADLAEWAFGGIKDAAGAVGDFMSDPLGSITDFAKNAGKAFTNTADTATKQSDKAQRNVSKSFDRMNANVSQQSSLAAANASTSMSKLQSSVTSQTGTAATNAEKNGGRIKSAWDKSYNTKLTATANTSGAESTMSSFKNRWSGFGVSGHASLSTSTASSTLRDWIYRNNNFVIHGSMNIRTNKTVTKGYSKDGGIVTHKHAAGYIADRPTVISQHIVGEAGAEAIIPLTNQRYVAPFARAVASYVNGGAEGGVTVTGNTFIVRRESDIAAIGRAINQDAERRRRAKL